MTGSTYEFNVKMTCSGCSGAVNRVLAKVPGIEYDVNLEKQHVRVTTEKEDTPSYEDIHEKIKKTGKEVISGKKVTKDAAAAEPPKDVPPAKVDEAPKVTELKA